MTICLLGCSQQEIRLETTADPTQGYVPVQLCDQRTWKSICGDYWDQLNARVACNQLGYSRESKYIIITEVVLLKNVCCLLRTII